VDVRARTPPRGTYVKDECQETAFLSRSCLIFGTAQTGQAMSVTGDGECGGAFRGLVWADFFNLFLLDITHPRLLVRMKTLDYTCEDRKEAMLVLLVRS
jgi:hypothetical protein